MEGRSKQKSKQDSYSRSAQSARSEFTPLQQILFRGKNSIISKSLLLYFIKVIIGLPPAMAGDNIMTCGEAEEAKRKY